MTEDQFLVGIVVVSPLGFVFIPKGETIRSAVRDKMRGLAYLAMVRQLARRCTDEISQRDRYLVKVGDQHYCPPAGVVKVAASVAS